jgi:hypothetical protein
VIGPVRVALEVADSAETARRLVAGGAEPLAKPVVTPWGHRNAKVRAPDGMQLTLSRSSTAPASPGGHQEAATHGSCRDRPRGGSRVGAGR